VPHKDTEQDVALRQRRGGLIGVRPKAPVCDNRALSVVYTPGVAEPCREIERDVELSYTYTWRWNAVAVVGAGVASLPRLETAAAALRLFGGVDGVPLAVDAPGGGRLSELLSLVAPTFGGIWLLAVGAEEAAAAAGPALDIPVLGPPPTEGAAAPLEAYAGLWRAVLDLRAREANDSVVAAALAAGGANALERAERAARAAARRLVALAAARTQLEPEIVAHRIIEHATAGRLSPAQPGSPEPADGGRTAALRFHGRLAATLEMTVKGVPPERATGAMLLKGEQQAVEAIARAPDLADELTCKGNLVAVVTDGSAVLGLGDIGAAAALPVMLGKSVLFKTFAGVDAVPACMDTRDPQRIVDAVEAVAPTFGGINLEDISAPRCFGIEEELKRRLDVFVFHDDQHGTAVVTLAGLLNAAKVCGKPLGDLTVTFNGAGAAGIAVAKLLLVAGVRDVILCDRGGAIYEGRTENMTAVKEQIARVTNRGGVRGPLAEAVRGRDVFIGLSVAGALTPAMVRSMADRPVVFAMANPVPEIMPAEARAAGAAVVATGRSDLPNQINNCLGFPGIFRGALDARARAINDPMKLAAARAIAALVDEKELRPDYVIPSAMDLRVGPAVAAAIAKSALETGQARATVSPDEIAERTRRLLCEERAGSGG